MACRIYNRDDDHGGARELGTVSVPGISIEVVRARRRRRPRERITGGRAAHTNQAQIHGRVTGAVTTLQSHFIEATGAGGGDAETDRLTDLGGRCRGAGRNLRCLACCVCNRDDDHGGTRELGTVRIPSIGIEVVRARHRRRPRESIIGGRAAHTNQAQIHGGVAAAVATLQSHFIEATGAVGGDAETDRLANLGRRRRGAGRNLRCFASAFRTGNCDSDHVGTRELGAIRIPSVTIEVISSRRGCGPAKGIGGVGFACPDYSRVRYGSSRRIT